MIGIFWIIAAVLFVLFVVLFLVRVLRKKAQLKDGLIRHAKIRHLKGRHTSRPEKPQETRALIRSEVRPAHNSIRRSTGARTQTHIIF